MRPFVFALKKVELRVCRGGIRCAPSEYEVQDFFPNFDPRPPDALRYRDGDSHPPKLRAARGALDLVVGEGLDGLRLAVDFYLPLQPSGLDAFRHNVSQSLSRARIADWEPAPCRRLRTRERSPQPIAHSAPMANAAIPVLRVESSSCRPE